MSARAASAPGAGVLDRLQVLRSAPTPLRGALAATWTPSPRTGVGPLRVPGPGLQPSSHDTTTTRTDPAGSTLARPDFGPKDGVHLKGPGGSNYGDNIATCDPTVIGPGTILQAEPGNMVGPTSQGVAALIALDPSASWNPAANGGLGAPSGGCMAAGSCGTSPRLVAIAVFDPDTFDSGRTSGRVDVVVTNILGFWIEGMQGNDVLGYFTYYPSLASGSSSISETSAFLRTVILVR